MMTLNLLAALILTVNGQVHDCKGGTVNHIRIEASDVTVQNCIVRESGTDVQGVNVFGNRNTMRRLTIERAGAAGVYFNVGDGHVLEDSIIRDPKRRVGRDSYAIANYMATNLTIRRVTVYGSGYTQWGDVPHGTKLIDNTFIIPEDYRTNCAGIIQRDGPCQCGEFGIAIKGGDNGIADGNTISGYRQSDPVCGGSGSPGAAISTAAGNVGTWTRKWTWTRNKISNSTYGIYIGPDTPDNVIEANQFCNNDTGVQDGYSVRLKFTDNNFYQSPLNVYTKTPGTVSGNRQTAECK